MCQTFIQHVLHIVVLNCENKLSLVCFVPDSNNTLVIKLHLVFKDLRIVSSVTQMQFWPSLSGSLTSYRMISELNTASPITNKLICIRVIVMSRVLFKSSQTVCRFPSELLYFHMVVQYISHWPHLFPLLLLPWFT